MNRFAPWISLTLLAIAGCSQRQSPSEGENFNAGIFGSRGKSELLDTIRRSDRIVVTEHSYRGDLYDPQTGKSPMPDDDLLYGTRDLDERQRQNFATIVGGLNEGAEHLASLCIFQSHHSIRFYLHDENLAVMNICFTCGQVDWNGNFFTPPWLIGGLSEFIEQIGFQPKRDWRALAEEHKPK